MTETSPNGAEAPSSDSLERRVADARADLARLLDGLNQVLIGKEGLTRRAVTAMLAGGHLLLEGLPGLGKTELVKGLSRLCAIRYSRVQFTPDLLPGDITGNFILEERDGRRDFAFRQGPIFANLVLADEINRASPKTQSALLECMQEATVTVLGQAFTLPRPFFVFATQNPIDLEGTYNLPEAQLDRFLMKLYLDRPDSGVLTGIIRDRKNGRPPELAAVLSEKRLRELMALSGDIFLAQPVAEFIARLVDSSHPDSPTAPDSVRRYVRFGASPRAAIALAGAARALALLQGRVTVGFDTVRSLYHDVLNHRVILDYAAKLDGVGVRRVLDDVLEATSEVGRELPAGISL